LQPTARDYQEALQHPDGCFDDPELKAGQPECDSLGLPRPISGSFASVFTIRSTDGRRFAVKCFVRYFADQHQRYDAISEFLTSVDASWKVDFRFLERGIRIRGRWFPILKMEWIEARPISRYVAEQLTHPTQIVALAEDFRTVLADLHARGAAHGDLQHGNVLVTSGGIVKLIDYDGMYVPALAGRTSHEVGHRNYQHPQRTERDFGLEIDNFSAWVIYLSLFATAADPGLWTRLGAGEEHLLFSSEDYAEPDLGAAMRVLALNPSAQLQRMAETIKANVRAGPMKVPVLSEMSVAIGAEVVIAPVGDVLSRGVHPEWMESHFPTPTVLSFPPRRTQRILTWTLLVLIAVGAPLVAVGFGPIIAGGLALALSSAWLASQWIAFHRTPELQARAQYNDRLAVAERDRRDRQKEKQQADRGLEKVAESEKKLRNSQERDASARATRHDAEIQRLKQATQQQIARIERQRNDAVASQQRELASALQTAQQAAYAMAMSRYRIGQSGAHGIGPALTGALAAHGLNTAADFSGTGRLMQVQGIGPAKAAALEGWRQGVESHVRKGLPTSLSSSERSRIVAQRQATITALDQQAKQTKATGTRDVAARAARHKAEEAAAAQDAQAGLLLVVAHRPNAMAEVQQAASALQQSELAFARCQRDLVPYRAIHFRQFVDVAARG
jgi:hypothetical protein